MNSWVPLFFLNKIPKNATKKPLFIVYVKLNSELYPQFQQHKSKKNLEFIWFYSN